MTEETWKLEAENRVRNLMWTVSGNYSLDTKLDMDSFERSKYISLYDAVKQGAFAKYFDKNALALYVVKKQFLGAEAGPLMTLAQTAVDMAVHKRAEAERSGVADLRLRAFHDVIELGDFRAFSESMAGRVKYTVMKQALEPGYTTTKKLTEAAEELHGLEYARTTMDIIRAVDHLYNQLFDQTFERRQGDLEEVLSVTPEELAEFGWKDFLKDLAVEESFEEYMRRVSQRILQTGEDEEPKEEMPAVTRVVKVSEEDLKKVYSYVELNFGKSYLTPLEQARTDQKLCRGAHVDCSLYYTEGILRNPVKNNYQYQYAKRQAEENRRYLRQHANLAKKHILELSQILKRALQKRSEPEYRRDDHGQVVPALLWRVGRCEDRRLFSRQFQRASSEFVVDVLMDASGSQQVRSPRVAFQGYLISCALSEAGIFHRVMSFCTFWDYTVMHRFRDYEDDKSADDNILEYSTSSNNRDGLAIRAAADGLLSRQEENRILIVLSDGRPNDMVINRPGSKNPKPYGGEYAVRDTASEVRRARNLGISVLGVFAGREEDLDAEKKIFGRDFAYIREIENFSNVVGRYLKRQVDLDP